MKNSQKISQKDSRKDSRKEHNQEKITVGFVGNPNCGKTTLFNAFTGAKLKVANWPGVTVEKVEGETKYHNTVIRVIDLPGIYSLTSYSIEEKVTRKCILDNEVDVIINVVDASNLERNLYLTLQLLELGKPVILALNMMDIVNERGMEIDLHRLPEMLGGIPVVPVSARKRTGLDSLMHAVLHHYDEGAAKEVFRYNDEIENKIEKLEIVYSAVNPGMQNRRWHAIKLLEYDEEETKYASADTIHIIDKNYEKEIIARKYQYIEEIIQEVLFNKQNKEMMTDKVDRVLTHPIWGVPIFLLIIAFVFFCTFTIGDALKGFFESGLEVFSENVLELLERFDVKPFMISLIVDGIIAGVGGILTFLPNIIILFFALALLEDSGYMARVAYVMDGIMGKVGLSGKAFLPMILGFGCTVPAVMATRSLEKEKDRKRVMMIVPFMSCSARLPIYVLFADMFFEKYSALVAYSLYLIGLVMAIAVAAVIGKFDKTESQNTLLIELPEYKMPNARTIFIYVWEKVRDYLTKAGTTIFIASIVLWVLLNCNLNGLTSDISQSFGAKIGKVLVPVLKPAGLGQWQIVVALISGLSAKEVVVSSFSVLYGVSNINSGAGMQALNQILSASGFGMLNAYALMIFCLLYTPCMAAVATVKKESASWKFTGKVIVFQLVFAWLMAVLVYQVGRLFV
ncbi:MAG: ferrous iron transport protein B [Lachnospiraceae bacterium]|nr:ferrous iron transport protein B [Lachnospiraceae bacterium]